MQIWLTNKSKCTKSATWKVLGNLLNKWNKLSCSLFSQLSTPLKLEWNWNAAGWLHVGVYNRRTGYNLRLYDTRYEWKTAAALTDWLSSRQWVCWASTGWVRVLADTGASLLTSDLPIFGQSSQSLQVSLLRCWAQSRESSQRVVTKKNAQLYTVRIILLGENVAVLNSLFSPAWV